MYVKIKWRGKMSKKMIFLIAGLIFSMMLTSCGLKQTKPVFSSKSVDPGSHVTRQGVIFSLKGEPIKIGHMFPDTKLIDSETMATINLNDFKGNVLFLSIVPSIDTKVCEIQTHYLGEEGDKLPENVKRITVSRDTPFAQSRFAHEADLEDMIYLSDYKDGSFGRSVGLLINDLMLLARSVVLVDKSGTVKYIQVVPEITNLPDMEQAFIKAKELTELN